MNSHWKGLLLFLLVFLLHRVIATQHDYHCPSFRIKDCFAPVFRRVLLRPNRTLLCRDYDQVINCHDKFDKKRSCSDKQVAKMIMESYVGALNRQANGQAVPHFSHSHMFDSIHGHMKQRCANIDCSTRVLEACKEKMLEQHRSARYDDSQVITAYEQFQALGLKMHTESTLISARLKDPHDGCEEIKNILTQIHFDFHVRYCPVREDVATRCVCERWKVPDVCVRSWGDCKFSWYTQEQLYEKRMASSSPGSSSFKENPQRTLLLMAVLAVLWTVSSQLSIQLPK